MNSTNPNRGHYNPPPTVTHPKTPAPDNRGAGQDNKSTGGKGGRS